MTEHETRQQMQIRIARAMQSTDPAKAAMWAAMADKARWYEPQEAKGERDDNDL